MLSRLGILFMRLLAFLPLAWVRLLGAALGRALYHLVPSRRRVADTNLRLCFPHWSEAERQAHVRRVFVLFAQTWLDRGWLWHAHPDVTLRRLKIVGEVDQLQGDGATVLFAPHFLGLDAGATALSQQVNRQFSTIYTPQSNAVLDEWIAMGRRRFGNAALYNRKSGVKPVLAALRLGNPLYLLPDMDFGPDDCLFVPFFGVPAATVPSLPRFARLGRARVVPVLTRLTPDGYEVKILPAWEAYPTGDLEADCRRMNEHLEAYIRAMPDQYYWVHKRFKTRPPGDADVYSG